MDVPENDDPTYEVGYGNPPGAHAFSSRSFGQSASIPKKGSSLGKAAAASRRALVAVPVPITEIPVPVTVPALVMEEAAHAQI
jgi:hypothetical protein